ncbi:unnamed protein product [Ectocarpus sp. 12 AP-2014]
MFDIANIAFEANLCDEEVTFTDKDGNTHTEKRWTCNGIIDLSQGQRIVEDELLKSCGGDGQKQGVNIGCSQLRIVGPLRSV